MSKNQVAPMKPAGVPAAYDYGKMAGAGFENTSGKDLNVPFITVLQSNSPQVEDKDPKGAESGMLFNTVTREMWVANAADDAPGLPFLLCHYDTAYVEWVPRDSGQPGGFVGLHDPNGPIVKEAIEASETGFGKLAYGKNELVETTYGYGLSLNPEGTHSIGFGVLSFSSTKLKPFRNWLTAIWTIKGTDPKNRPPSFCYRSIIRTVKQKNDFGTFYNFRVDPWAKTWVQSMMDPSVEGALLKEADDFREMVISGMAKADFAKERSADGSGTAGGGDGEDAPF